MWNSRAGAVSQPMLAFGDRTDRLFWAVTGLALVLAAGGVYLVSELGAKTAPRPPRVPPPGPATHSAGRSEYSPAARARRRLVFAQVQGDEAFRRLGEPAPGDWLHSFREPGQTLWEYAASRPNRKIPGRETLHLLPFTDLDPVQRRQVPLIREHTALFFDTPVVTLPARPVSRSWLDRRREQHDADLIVSDLARRVPDESLGLFGLMGSDLFGLGLNFVFGEALLEERAGIYSLRRYGRASPMLLRRALKLSAHEIGHMFGLKHCVFYECVMNGVNSLVEMDRSPLHLCPVCLAKLQWNLRFDAPRRYRRLAAFYRRVGLEGEARFALARSTEVEVYASTGPPPPPGTSEAR